MVADCRLLPGKMITRHGARCRALVGHGRFAFAAHNAQTSASQTATVRERANISTTPRKLNEPVDEHGSGADKRGAGNDTLGGIRAVRNEAERERSEDERHHTATNVLEAQA